MEVDPALFAALLRAARSHVSKNDRESTDFLAALGSECVPAKNKNEVKPTALHMTSGNQKFLETLRELAKSLDVTQPAHGKASCPPARRSARHCSESGAPPMSSRRWVRPGHRGDLRPHRRRTNRHWPTQHPGGHLAGGGSPSFVSLLSRGPQVAHPRI